MTQRRRQNWLPRAGGLVVIAALWCGFVVADDGGSSPDPQPELMRQIVQEEGLDTRRQASPSSYLGHVFETLVERLWMGISDSPALRGTSRIVVWAVVLIAGALLLWVIGGLIYQSWTRRRAGPRRGVGPIERELPSAPNPRDEFARALERRDAPGALRALWRWIVSSLASRGTVLSQDGATHREILELARRREPAWEGLPALRELTRCSERWLYRGEPFGVDEVSEMRERLADWLR